MPAGELQLPTGDDSSPRAVSPNSAPAATANPRVHYHVTARARFPSLERIDTRYRSIDGPRDHILSPSVLRRRSTRAATFRTVDGADDMELPFPERPGWQPGAEPGYDPKLPDGGHGLMPALSAKCDITVVDFSLENIAMRQFENDTFIEFLKEPKQDWAKCRWINVNGLSWDVIQAIGANKGLHKLALEDIMNLKNRTKADWYVALDCPSRNLYRY